MFARTHQGLINMRHVLHVVGDKNDDGEPIVLATVGSGRHQLIDFESTAQVVAALSARGMVLQRAGR